MGIYSIINKNFGIGDRMTEEDEKQFRGLLKEFEERDKKTNKIVFKKLDQLIEREIVDRAKEISGFEKAIKYFTDKLDLAQKFIGKIPLYYDEACLWWMWNHQRKCWEIKDEIDILNKISNTSFANTISSKERTEILNALKQVARLNKPKKASPDWLQFNREIVDLNSGKRFPSSPEYFVTNPIPWDLGQSEETPTIDKIFEQWVGKDYVQTLYEVLAYSLLPSYPLHRLFCFFGEGLNGKSCYLRLIKKFVGISNTTTTELDTLIKSRFEITRLHKKLVCIMGETNFSEIEKTSIIKQLTGQDTIGFEYKNKNPFEGENYAKIIIATNNLPTTSDKTIGFYRRWLIIDFPNRFTEKKDVLGDIPEKEFENLAMKCIGVLMNLMKKREFHNEGDVRDKIKRYEDRSNPFDKFWNENLEEDFDSFITKFDFKKKIEEWCRENRFRSLSDISINKHMRNKGVEGNRVYIDWFDKGINIKKQVKAWAGIRFQGQVKIKQEPELKPEVVKILK